MAQANLMIRYTLPNIFRIGPKRFYPGINEITPEEWKAIKDHPMLPHRFEVGALVWVDGKGPDDFPKKPADDAKDDPQTDDEEDTPEEKGASDNPLDGVNVKATREIIEETYDLDLLAKWKDGETRKVVISAIEKQEKKIVPSPKTKKKKIPEIVK